MITEIGIAAGEIWTYLENHDKSDNMENIVAGVKMEKELVLMSIGWLAREGHVILKGDRPNYTVSLTGKRESE